MRIIKERRPSPYIEYLKGCLSPLHYDLNRRNTYLYSLGNCRLRAIEITSPNSLKNLQMKPKLSLIFSLLLPLCTLRVTAQNQQKADSLERQLTQEPQDTGRVLTLIALGHEYGANEPNKSIDIFRKAIQLADQLNFQKGLNKASIEMGSVFINMSASDSAKKYFNAALSRGTSIKDSVTIADAYNGLAKNDMVQGNQTGSIQNYQRAIGIYQRRKLSSKEASASIYLSMAFSDLGSYEQALKYAMRAEELFKLSNDKYGLGKVYLTIGDVYNGQFKYAEALPHYRRGLALMTELNNKSAIANASLRVGGMETELGKFDSAIYHFDKTLEISQELKMPALESDALMGKAGVYYGQKNFELALQNSNKALALNKSIDNIFGYLNNYNLLSLIYYDTKNYDKAEEYGGDFLNVANQMGAVDQARLALDRLTKIEQAKGDYKKAFGYMQKLTTINDSLRNGEQAKTVQDLETKYETYKKDQQIALLNTEEQLKNTELAEQRLELGGSISLLILLMVAGGIVVTTIQRRRKVEAQVAQLEKQNEIEALRNKISLDIHDDIGSGLTKINLMLNQFKNAVGSDTSPEMKELAGKISSRSKEVISGLGEVVWTANPSHDNLKSLLGFMRDYISRFLEETGIRYQVDFPEGLSERKIHPELKRNLFLVLKESLNNIIKHSDAREVTIQFKLDGPRFLMEIRDDGSGIDEKVMSKFGNGLNSMKQRMLEIKGRFNLKSTPENGTEILLEGNLY